ncbi:MAG: RsmB/NOP family class I SAM-dependent RNA methyltransferase [Daejeonella sp.]
MRYEQQLKTFLRVLNEYPANTPLTKFLPVFFKKNKQMGSTDRRTAGRLLYSFFRLGQAAKHLPAEQRLFLGEFLCSTNDNPFFQHFRPDLNEQIGLSLPEKIKLLKEKEGFDLKTVFPFISHLSSEIKPRDFLTSFFVQPDLYIRMHSGRENLVKQRLKEMEILFQETGEHTLALPNGTKLDKIFTDGQLFYVQDLSSQKTLEYFKPKRYDSWWDACAGSGGKSLLLFSEEPDIKLLVSDIRESILNNLDERFIEAGLRTYQKKVIDLCQNPDPILHHYQFGGIILDAPCSGSGTWSRTPEMISQFEEYKISGFQNLQKTIAANVIKYLKPGKPLIYITCSVFKQENEEVVNYLVTEHGLKLEAQELIKGYEHKADTMFVARLSTALL